MPTISSNNGHYVIKTGATNDNITITQKDDNYQINVNGKTTEVAVEDVKSMVIDTGAGDDFIDFQTLRPGAEPLNLFNDQLNTPDVDGTLSQQPLTEAPSSIFTPTPAEEQSGPAPFVVLAGDGDDTVLGGAGNDYIVGGFGHDKISGGAGADMIAGDYVPPENGLHQLVPADIRLRTNYTQPYSQTAHPDAVRQSGTVTIPSHPDTHWDSNDVILGGPGNDTIYGNEGNDEIYGQSGYDTIYGGDGHDFIHGGNEPNEIIEGEDFIDGGLGKDQNFFSHPKQSLPYIEGLDYKPLWDDES